MAIDEFFTIFWVGNAALPSLLLLMTVANSVPEIEPATAAPVFATDDEFDFESIYEEHLPILVSIAIRRFGIPECDAQTLAHEIFVDFLLKGATIVDQRGWLIGAICNASRYYLRTRARAEPLPDTFAEEPDPHLARVLEMWPDQLAARQAFSRVTARCQLVLRLRYLEGYSVPELARELGITKRYAAKLVSECLRQAHRRYVVATRAGARDA